MIFPTYPTINTIKDVTIILKVGTNRATKWFEQKINKYPYDKVFTHAFLYLTQGDCVDVGFTTSLRKLHDIMKSKAEYLSIHLDDLTKRQRSKALSIGYNKAGAKSKKFKFYDVWGYVAFGLRRLGMKKVKGSKRYDFCSDQVVDVLKEVGYKLFDDVDSETTSPCDLFLLLEDYPDADIAWL
ncbi:hypothetical protein LCGC14_2614430 [marine sediment metagenome]|uniref:Uncharacterized protein n=1 Tax=marine sediment metagenome TaxID=412755 RepID=A0A0F9CG06_9ZZZZ